LATVAAHFATWIGMKISGAKSKRIKVMLIGYSVGLLTMPCCTFPCCSVPRRAFQRRRAWRLASLKRSARYLAQHRTVTNVCEQVAQYIPTCECQAMVAAFTFDHWVMFWGIM